MKLLTIKSLLYVRGNLCSYKIGDIFYTYIFVVQLLQILINIIYLLFLIVFMFVYIFFYYEICVGTYDIVID